MAGRKRRQGAKAGGLLFMAALFLVLSLWPLKTAAAEILTISPAEWTGAGEVFLYVTPEYPYMLCAARTETGEVLGRVKEPSVHAAADGSLLYFAAYDEETDTCLLTGYDLAEGKVTFTAKKTMASDMDVVFAAGNCVYVQNQAFVGPDFTCTKKGYLLGYNTKTGRRVLREKNAVILGTDGSFAAGACGVKNGKAKKFFVLDGANKKLSRLACPDGFRPTALGADGKGFAFAYISGTSSNQVQVWTTDAEGGEPVRAGEASGYHMKVCKVTTETLWYVTSAHTESPTCRKLIFGGSDTYMHYWDFFEETGGTESW